MTPYDLGYASIDSREKVGPNDGQIDPAALVWRPANIRLHIGWMAAKPDEWSRGRHDALCDVLARTEVLA